MTMTLAPTHPPLRFGLFNVKYSSNLGDGLLSECLEAELQRALPGATTLSLDLAGRLDYEDGATFRGLALAILGRSPAFARQKMVEAVLGGSLKRRMRPYWRRALRELDAVVVGGGNLFGDADLNFPLKINAALAETREAGLPAAVFGVGVSDNWTPRGTDLFRGALGGLDLVHVSVRDEQSGVVWARRLGAAGIAPAAIGYDPGLLVAHHVPAVRRAPSASPTVGIGITNPFLLRYHADERGVTNGKLTQWFAALTGACRARGWRVALFTNGSREDEAFLRRIGPALVARDPDGGVTCTPRCRRPAELAAFISGLDLVMAHRLHANIAAFSYAVPQIGFTWDAKMRHFFARVDRADFLCSAGIDHPEHVAQLAERALREGIDTTRHVHILAAARDSIEQLAQALSTAVVARGDARAETTRRAAAW